MDNRLEYATKTLAKIQQHLENGGIVLVAGYGRAVQYERKHKDMFLVSKSGSLCVRRGKSLDSIMYSKITYWTHE